MLSGNLASIGMGGVIAVTTSLIWPDDFDFGATRAINAPSLLTADAGRPERASDEYADEKKRAESEVSTQPVVDPPEEVAAEEERELDPRALKKAFRIAAWASVALVSGFRPL